MFECCGIWAGLGWWVLGLVGLGVGLIGWICGFGVVGWVLVGVLVSLRFWVGFGCGLFCLIYGFLFCFGLSLCLVVWFWLVGVWFVVMVGVWFD